MICKCESCGANFEISSGRAAFMVLTGGAKCPICEKEDGICIIAGVRKG